jgi:hypothetical protein
MATTMVRQSGVTPISTDEEGAEAILNLTVADVPASSTLRSRGSDRNAPEADLQSTPRGLLTFVA